MPQISSLGQQFKKETTHKKINMSDYDSNNEMPFTVETRGYLYESEYTEEDGDGTGLCIGIRKFYG